MHFKGAFFYAEQKDCFKTYIFQGVLFIMERKNTQFFTPTRIAVIAMFATLAGVLYAFGFPINVAFPFWLELNFSDIPALIGTFAMGPLSGGIIVFVKILIKLIIKGTSTMFVGELADLVIGLAFVVPAGLIYKRHRTFRGALAGMGVGTLCSVALSVLANWLILVPFYLRLFFGGDWNSLIAPMQALFGDAVTRETFYNFYLWVSVLPFNLMRCLIAVLVTLPVYKRISVFINRMNERFMPKAPAGEDGEASVCAATKKRTIVTVAVCAGVVLLLVGGVLLRYFLS